MRKWIDRKRKRRNEKKIGKKRCTSGHKNRRSDTEEQDEYRDTKSEILINTETIGTMHIINRISNDDTYTQLHI